MEKLKKLAAKKRLTKDEREYIAAMAETVGLKVTNPKCGQCWQDLAVRTVLALQAVEAGGNNVPEGRRLVIRDGVDVRFCGIRVTPATIDSDEAVQQLLDKGLPRRWVREIKGGE